MAQVNIPTPPHLAHKPAFLFFAFLCIRLLSRYLLKWRSSSPYAGVADVDHIPVTLVEQVLMPLTPSNPQVFRVSCPLSSTASESTAALLQRAYI